MKTRSMYKAEPMSLDRISTLPEPILETILCLLPTRVAARTSVLSREWRYKWTKIPKLELYHSMRCASVSKQTSGIASTRKNINMRCKSCHDIQQILLLRQGPIHELTLDMPDDKFLELDQIMLQLSRNHPVKKLTLNGRDHLSPWYKLPISVFSLHHLTDLSIRHIDLDHPPICNGFGSLGNLYLRHSGISTKTLLHFLSKCPSLKRLSLFISYPVDKCTINQLFECLPSIEHLTTWSSVKWLVLDSAPQKLSTSLIHLKYFCFQEVNIGDSCVLAFLLLLIKCSPNLEKIKLESDDVYNYEEDSVVWEKYSDVWLEHLYELEIGWFENSMAEMDFVKYILARSPKLKKVTILSVVEKKQGSKILNTLLQAPRVSPVVITVT